jgi:hypothetical protein
MGPKLCTRSSRLHVSGVGTSILQTLSNCEEWRRSLYVVEESITTNWWMNRCLLQTFVGTC